MGGVAFCPQKREESTLGEKDFSPRKRVYPPPERKKAAPRALGARPPQGVGRLVWRLIVGEWRWGWGA